MDAVSSTEFSHMITILSDTINRVDDRALTRHDETLSRLDAYIAASESRLRQVENSQLIMSQAIKVLEESGEEHWATRHPILAGAVNFVVIFILVTIIAKFAPGVAKLIGSI